MPKRNPNTPTTIDAATGREIASPPPKRRQFRLTSLSAVRKEMAGVYAAVRNGEIDSTEGARLTYMLSSIGKIIVDAELEKRIEALEKLRE